MFNESLPSQIRAFRWGTAVAFALTLITDVVFWQIAFALSVSFRSVLWTSLFVGMTLVTLGELVLLIGLFVRGEAVGQWVARFSKAFAGSRSRAIILMVVLLVLFPVFVFAQLETYLFASVWPRAWLAWHVLVLLVPLLSTTLSERSTGFLALFAALLVGTSHWLGVFAQDISTYPFSLHWSEVSRYFYASLFFAERLYGADFNPTVLHPSRYMMQAVPFLVDGVPLWGHRVWQVFLWVGTNALTAYLLAKRLMLDSREIRWGVGLWAFLFLLQGPIWYHLLVVVIIILWAFDRHSFWRNMLFIALAAAWAGISRINWIPFPGVLAVFLYVLETRRDGRGFFDYWVPPVIWTITGLIVGFASERAYAVWSGNDLAQFGSSLTSDLLWYRLLPSPTFPLGILPGIVLVSLPVIWLMGQVLRGRWQEIDTLRVVAAVSILGVFFAGGLLVSVKIGGGSNLHNLDGYLAFLLVAGAYVLVGKPALDVPGASLSSPSRWNRVALVLLVALPVYFALSAGHPYDIVEPDAIQRAFNKLERFTRPVVNADGEVLLLAERHLPLFGELSEVKMVDDYERVFLMEMAMSENEAYLAQFREDLRTHRFGLIVAEPQVIRFEEGEKFAEENNAWAAQISIPIMCYYEPVDDVRKIRMVFFLPRATVSEDCPLP